MFIGHYGAALALKPLERRLNLFWLFLAAMFLDILWPIFNLLGIEHTRIDPGHIGHTPYEFVSYPFSHSLLATLAWAGLVYLLLLKVPIAKGARSSRVALIMAVAVISHWILDFIVHEPDLSLWGGDPKVGLSLWQYPTAEFVVETLIFIAGLFLYLHSTRSNSFGGRYGMIFFAFVLFALFTMTTFSAGAPPSIEMAAIVGLVMAFVLALIAGWLDRKRVPGSA